MGVRSQRQVLIAAAAALAACAGLSAPPATGPEGDGRAAVNALVQRYEAPTSERFFDLIDSRRFPNYDGFFDAVRQFQLKNRAIILDVVVDAVDANGDALGVRAHWNKSFVNPQGTNKLATGQCEFLFRRQPSGGWLLTAIQGTSPF